MKKLLLLALVAALAACSAFASAEGLSVDKLTVTYVTSPLNVPTILEKDAGVFASALGIPVEYAEITSGADQTQALASGDVQLLYAVGGTSVILSAANGADIKVLNMYSRAPKAFCLYAKDETLTSPESLRGKVIAGPAGTNLHELLVAYLNTAGMTLDDVQYVSMGIPEAKAALDSGSADAALLRDDSTVTVIDTGEEGIAGIVVYAVAIALYLPFAIKAIRRMRREHVAYRGVFMERALAKQDADAHPTATTGLPTAA